MWVKVCVHEWEKNNIFRVMFIYLWVWVYIYMCVWICICIYIKANDACVSMYGFFFFCMYIYILDTIEHQNNTSRISNHITHSADIPYGRSNTKGHLPIRNDSLK